jgi:hypothetical protein
MPSVANTLDIPDNAPDDWRVLRAMSGDLTVTEWEARLSMTASEIARFCANLALPLRGDRRGISRLSRAVVVEVRERGVSWNQIAKDLGVSSLTLRAARRYWGMS